MGSYHPDKQGDNLGHGKRQKTARNERVSGQPVSENIAQFVLGFFFRTA